MRKLSSILVRHIELNSFFFQIVSWIQNLTFFFEIVLPKLFCRNCSAEIVFLKIEASLLFASVIRALHRTDKKNEPTRFIKKRLNAIFFNKIIPTEAVIVDDLFLIDYIAVPENVDVFEMTWHMYLRWDSLLLRHNCVIGLIFFLSPNFQSQWDMRKENHFLWFSKSVTTPHTQIQTLAKCEKHFINMLSECESSPPNQITTWQTFHHSRKLYHISRKFNARTYTEYAICFD